MIWMLYVSDNGESSLLLINGEIIDRQPEQDEYRTVDLYSLPSLMMF